MDDEQFAASLRPSSIFGALGAEDEHEDPGEYSYTGDEETYYSDGGASQSPAPSPIPPATPTNSAIVPRVPSGGSSGAAITLFTVVAGAAAGWYFGKFKGAAGGALAGGALRNLYRTQQAVRSGEAVQKVGAMQQGMIGLAGLGAGSYLLWTANRK